LVPASTPPQTWPLNEHVPQELTLRGAPQLSLPLSAPHWAPAFVQNVGSLSGVQPHWFAVPPPPHDSPVPEHVPHEATLRGDPQLSVPLIAPQLAPAFAQNVASLSGMQPQ
jgi:hypothetical protein